MQQVTFALSACRMMAVAAVAVLSIATAYADDDEAFLPIS
jgi:hypothetical protein